MIVGYIADLPFPKASMEPIGFSLLSVSCAVTPRGLRYTREYHAVELQPRTSRDVTTTTTLHYNTTDYCCTTGSNGTVYMLTVLLVLMYCNKKFCWRLWWSWTAAMYEHLQLHRNSSCCIISSCVCFHMVYFLFRNALTNAPCPFGRCFKKSLPRSIFYMLRDMGCVLALQYIYPDYVAGNWLATFAWWNANGFMLWCLFVVGEYACPGGSLSRNDGTCKALSWLYY